MLHLSQLHSTWRTAPDRRAGVRLDAPSLWAKTPQQRARGRPAGPFNRLCRRVILRLYSLLRTALARLALDCFTSIPFAPCVAALRSSPVQGSTPWKDMVPL
jgi:hypothetical protein